MSFVLSALFLFAEIQFSLCPADLEKTLVRLEIFDAMVQERTTYFFDTKDGFLHRRGVALRLRVTERKSTLTVKARDVSTSDLPLELRQAENLKCEYDVHPHRLTPSCALGYRLQRTDVAELIGDPQLLGELLSSSQLQLLAVKGITSLGTHTLRTLGPILQQFAKVEKLIGEQEASLELSLVGKSYRRMEFSTRYPASERQNAGAEVSQFLQQKGVTLCDAQQPSPLEYLLRDAL